MPKKRAEIAKTYREKLKTKAKYGDYKKKQAEIMKKQRALAKDKEKEMALVSPAQHQQYIDKKRQSDAERSKRYRENKKSELKIMRWPKKIRLLLR